MKHINLKSFLRDSIIIALILGIIAGVLSISISNALFARKPNWEYVLTVVLFIAILLLARFSITLYSAVKDLSSRVQGGSTTITKTEPPLRVTLGEALLNARTELVFFGISAKRSVTDDAFKRAIEHLEDHQLRIRFLLLDPSSEAFVQRVRDEGESSDAWNADQQVATSRLGSYKRRLNLNIELRYFDSYPIWRAIIIDREEVFVSVFLPGKRGTEVSQYRLSRVNEELAYGIINAYHTAWHEAREEIL